MRNRRTTVIQALASQIERFKRCAADKRFAAAADDAKHTIDCIVHLLPSGSGIDNGTEVDFDASGADKPEGTAKL